MRSVFMFLYLRVAVLVLPENKACGSVGTQQSGQFTVRGDVARVWLGNPNPHGQGTHEVLRRWANGEALTDRDDDLWVVDFGLLDHAHAALFELPYQHLLKVVKPVRERNNREAYRRLWWRHAEARATFRPTLSKCSRFIATPRVAKHRFFVWLDQTFLPDTRLFAVARQDDATFGLLSARVHESWSIANASMHGVGNDPTYNAKSCFETFPFPAGLTPADTAHQRTEALPDGALIPADLPGDVRAHAEAIARAAKRLVDLRDAWLNPPEWTERIPEVIPLGMDKSPYPDRIVAKPGFEKEVARRTLTNLYNQRPAWLAQAHEALDAAVAAAYGWSDYTNAMPDDEILRRLLALNLARAEAQQLR